ncbi:MAG: TetR/AcrR family transcriptional regulator [Moritella sp.]|uniref:TetR/AcrR family transcriptional regulator n=1 Tax=Moritella sp. TaxID=78556 RepID=UPI0029A6701B|nr:TetR/AcrR family transcriptional regulator [Moritella sp.]MDX2321849.1 TetR/AcrR family transcriptional regulator [Moritella sp.]
MNLKQEKSRRRSPSQNRSKERVEVILQAVKELIEEQGISNLKITEIASRANTSPSSLYQYFADKDTMVQSLAQQFMAQIHTIVEKHAQNLQSFDDLEKVLSENFDDIYALHKNESALQQIWSDSINKDLINLATYDSTLKADKMYLQVRKVAKPKDEAQLKQFILLMSIQLSSIMRMCFCGNFGTPEQFKKIFVENVILWMKEYTVPIK